MFLLVKIHHRHWLYYREFKMIMSRENELKSTTKYFEKHYKITSHLVIYLFFSTITKKLESHKWKLLSGIFWKVTLLFLYVCQRHITFLYVYRRDILFLYICQKGKLCFKVKWYCRTWCLRYMMFRCEKHQDEKKFQKCLILFSSVNIYFKYRVVLTCQTTVKPVCNQHARKIALQGALLHV